MNPIELLLRARAVLKARRDDVKGVAALFAEADGLLELEIAGAWLVRHLPHAPVFAWLRSPDSAERRAAIAFVERLGASGARFLRYAVKDSDAGLVGFARAAARRLGLPDVAPPDRAERRVVVPPGHAYRRQVVVPPKPGGWNRTGWSAGMSRDLLRRRAPRVWSSVRRSPWKSTAALLEALQLSERDVRWISRPVGARGSAYVEFQVPKRKGMRSIAAPRKRLKGVQRWLLDHSLGPLPLHAAAHGFRTAHSVITNARPHVGAGLVVKMDLQDFFPSVHFRRVYGLMMSLGHPADVAHTLARLTTYRRRLPDGRISQPGVLPQGAPTSPVIANLISKQLDARLAGLAKKWGAAYTRYADDLTFSFKERHPPKLGRFLWWVNAICQQEGFIENASKRRLLRSGSRQTVTGLVVNERVSVPRHVRRRFRAIVHNAKKHGLASQARGVENFEAWLHGMAAYLAMVHPGPGARWLAEVKAMLAGKVT